MTSADLTDDDQRLLSRGLVFVVLAMIILPGQDAIAKLASATVPVIVINIVRFGLQAVLTLPFVVRRSGWRGLVPNRPGVNILRGALIALGSMCFFTSLKYLPLADALAIFFVEPLIVTILSSVLDKEVVGWRRRTAVLVGFVGALIVIQPSFGIFGWVTLLPLAAAFVFSFYFILNRRASRHDGPHEMLFTSGATAAVMLGAIVLAGLALGADWGDVSLGRWEIGLLLLMGVVGTSGHFLLVRAAHDVPSSLLAPFSYLEIVGAAALGYLIFGDFPEPVKWIGILIIVASGVFVFWRERQVGRKTPVLPLT